jgi:hypothetical protein
MTSERGEAAATVEAGAAHERALAVVTQRLAVDFPARAEQVGDLVAQAYARTRGARVQAFRVLLAERDARAELRRTLGHGGRRALR